VGAARAPEAPQVHPEGMGHPGPCEFTRKAWGLRSCEFSRKAWGLRSCEFSRKAGNVQILTCVACQSRFVLMLSAPPLRQRLDLDDARTSAVAKQAFFRVAGLWQLSNEQARVLLGNPSRSTYFSWKKGEGGNLSRDTFERISYVLGIYKALQILFTDPQQADAWITKRNEAFGGHSALERMTAGNVSDLHAVRAYLDYVRGGGS